jgi:hypothetical protein
MVLPQPDAEEDVVCCVIFRAQEVRVVGGHHRQAEVVAEPEDLPVQLILPGRVVPLHLQIVAAVEELGVPGSGFPRLIPPVLHQVLRDLAGQAGAGYNQAFGVLRQHLPVDPRLEVEALREAERGELRQVPVTLRVPRQHHQMVVALLALHLAPVTPAAGGHIRLHPDDRLDALLLRLLVKDPRPVHHAMVRQGDGRLLELLRTTDEVSDAIGAVEKGVLGMAVQMAE